MVRGDILVLFLILGVQLPVFTIKHEVSCGFFMGAHDHVEEVPHISSLLSVFVMKGCWTLMICFKEEMDRFCCELSCTICVRK